jgi:hypothetical protein
MNVSIKTIFKFVLLIMVAVTVLWACEEQLVQEPKGTIVADAYYQTESQALQGVVGIYNRLSENDLYGSIMNRFTSGASDDMVGNIGSPELHQYSFSPSSGIFRETWNAFYDVIHRANLLMINIEGSEEISQSAIDHFTAEAKFLRALSYFHMVNIWGGVPLLTEPVPPARSKEVGRATASEVYALIESDLQTAIQGLPTKGELEDGRASKEAAQALLTKVYLHQEKWQETVNTANDIINSGTFSLHYPYYQIFRHAYERHSGQIFSIVYSEAGPQGWGDGNEGNNFSIWFRPGGWGQSQPSDALENSFEPGDERFRATVSFEGDKVVVPGQKIVPPDYELQEGESLNEEIPTIPSRSYGKMWMLEGNYGADRKPLDWPVLRYGDVLLMKAEALAEMGDLAGVEAPMTEIRNRAGLGDYSTSGKNQQQVIEDVRLERQRELALDGYRNYDLRRWGILVETILANVDDPNLVIQANRHELYPIPQTEIDLSEGALTQNPGYPGGGSIE